MSFPFLDAPQRACHEKATTYSCSGSICPCRVFHTAMFHDWKVQRMTSDRVFLEAKLQTCGTKVDSSCRGLLLDPIRCAHDLCGRFTVIVTMSQWLHVIQHCSCFLVVAARLRQGDILDTCADFAGVAPDPAERTNLPNSDLSCVELFAGSFSGWSQVISACTELGFPCKTRMALDLDHDCISAYSKTFHIDPDEVFGPWSFEWLADQLPTCSLIESDVRSYKWLHLVGMQTVDLMTCSPPCPPWSRANRAPGLTCSEGQLLLDTCGIAKIIRPKVLCIEMVSGLGSHSHFRMVKDFLQHCGYYLKWSQTLNLKEVLPQNRERILLIGTRFADPTINAHICVSWPLHVTPNLHSAKILMDYAELLPCWKDAARVTTEALKMYMDPCLLPIGFPDDRTKKSRVAVESYRIRYPQDAFGCIMASYGVAHELPRKMLLNHGLYGTILYDDNTLRFMSVPEIILLQGAIRPLFFGGEIRDVLHQLGNCIATPHAAIAIANALAILTDTLDGFGVQRLFDRIFALRLTADDLCIHEVHGGWWFSRGNDTIPATIPIHDFIEVVLRYDDDHVRIQCEKHLDIWAVLLILMSDRRPLSLHFRPVNFPGLTIDLPKPFFMHCKSLTFFCCSKPVLQLHPCITTEPESLLSPAVCMISDRGTFAMHYGNVPSIQSAVTAIGDMIDGECTPTNALGFPLELDEPLPYHFVLVENPPKPIDISPMELVKVSYDAGLIQISSTPMVMQEFLSTLSHSGIMQLVHAFGWKFMRDVFSNVPSDEWDCVTLVPTSGNLSIAPDDARNGLICLTFAMNLAMTKTFGSSPYVKVDFLLLGTQAWTGRLGVDVTCEFFLHVWQRVCRLFQFDLPLRFLIGGKQVNPDLPIGEYITPAMLSSGAVRIHTVLGLRGGGPVSLSPGPESSQSRPSEQDIFQIEKDHLMRAVSLVIADWLSLPGQSEEFRTDSFLTMQLDIQDGFLLWSDRLQTLLTFNRMIKKTGIELILNKLGWFAAVQFTSADNETIGRFVMFPRPEGKTCSRDLVLFFLQAAFLRFALPTDQVPSRGWGVHTRVKIFGQVIFSRYLPGGLPCSDMIDAWDQAANMVAKPQPIRLLICGRQASPEYKLLDYAKTSPAGDRVASVDWVAPLRGGGGADVQPSSAMKNQLATYLLHQGGDMTEIAPFVTSIAKAGAVAMTAILEERDKSHKLDSLKRLAATLGVKMPDLQVRQNDAKKRVNGKMGNLANLDIFKIVIKEGFFTNQDGTACQQRQQPQPGAAGISILNATDAAPWIGQTISADEQALLILGKCPCQNPASCQRINLPGYIAEEPMIFNSCLHQLGQKHVKIVDSNVTSVQIAMSNVVALTAYKDELPPTVWSKLLDSPVKVTLDLLFQESEAPTLLAPPWGRSFQDNHGRNSRTDAVSFQVHCRVARKDLNVMLRASGHHGVYTTPKTEDRRICLDYSIIWLSLTPVQMSVTAGTCDNSLGIVRQSRHSNKTTRGLRFLKEDFQAAFEKLRPGEDLPSQIQCKHLFKVSPVPVGATAAEILEWIKVHKWNAKPLRALTANTWLCGSEDRFETEFPFWNDQPMLITWIQQRNQSKPLVLAGSTPAVKKMVTNPQDISGLPPLRGDPWGKYESTQEHVAARLPKASAAPVTRKIEAPIESRFQSQQQELEDLRESTSKQLAEIREGMKELKQDTSDQFTAHQKDVQQEFKALRSETQSQFKQLSGTFAETLQQAIAKQDSTLSSQISELKLLLMNRPNPAKKAKSQPSTNGDISQDDANLWLCQVTWRFGCYAVGTCAVFFQHMTMFCICQMLIQRPIAIAQFQVSTLITGSVNTRPFWSLPPMHKADTQHLLPVGFHSMFFAQRVGEAQNPGPRPCRFSVINPTAVLRKSKEILDLKADVVCAAETSATTLAQDQITKSLGEKKFRSFWSLPVQSRQETLDHRPSLRGESLGTAIFTTLPSRRPRVTIPVPLEQSLRFCCSVIRIGQFEVLVVSVYGFPTTSRVQNGIRMNDLLLSYTWDVIQHVGLPFIVCGDFNEPPMKLPIFQAFAQVGAVEANQWYLNKFGSLLPPTCRNATRNDTAIIHPFLANFLKDVQVIHDFAFDSHSPMFLDFDLDIPQPAGIKWCLPQSWAPFAPPAELIEKHFNRLHTQNKFPLESIHSSDDGIHALLTWSQHVEHAVHLAIAELHSQDPIRYPWPGLPGKYKGRCDVPTAKTLTPATSVGGDRPGGYTPPCEIFSLPAKLKTKQMRRLLAFQRAMKSTRMDDNRKHALLTLEWKKILAAAGYGRSWYNWILGFDSVPFCPREIPPYDFLEVATAVTKIDCDHACFVEMRNRKLSFRYKMELDNSQDFNRLSYKLMRGKNHNPLQEVPAKRSCTASLCRAKKGESKLHVIGDSVPLFTVNAPAMFGSAQILITKQCDRFIHFKLTEGHLPSSAILVQDYVACSSDDIFQEFHKFWEPFWKRDSFESQFTDDEITSFVTELDDLDLPQIPVIQVPIHDPQLWFDAAQRLKPGKAHGPCAWRHEELKCLPLTCFVKLALIFHRLQSFCLDGFMMKARTILLPKNFQPQSMNQVRPITIISALFRLYGKIVFRCVTDVWKEHFPWAVMGGLPGKGAKDLGFSQKLSIEKAIASKECLGGFSLDLVKAFNTFRRRMLFHAMVRLGIPETVVSFWIRSLSRMQRHPEIHGLLGPGMTSTVGAPEGDCMSVLGMLALSCIFYFKLKSAHDDIHPFCYADNWSWMCSQQRAHFKAMIAMLNITKAMGVTVDYTKSWHWGVTKNFRNFQQELQLLFPSGDLEIPVKTYVKDLGEIVSYNKSAHVDAIRSRIDEAITRIHRLKFLPCPVQEKFKLIQSSAWPVALYAAEFNYIGKKHFQDLRKAVTVAMVGKRHFANAWITCSMISHFITDPLLFVLGNILRHLRRLATSNPEQLSLFIRLFHNFDGARAFGPASTFKLYLQSVDWSFQEDGTLQCGLCLKCNIWTDSFSFISSVIKRAWPLMVLQNLERKGTGDYIPHSPFAHRVFASFPDADQKLLLYFFSGALQNDSIRAKWKTDQTPLCPFCDEHDTRPHRLTQCKAFENIRDDFPDAVAILQDVRPEWCYLPLPRAPPNLELSNLLFATFPETHEVQAFPTENTCVCFYVDGGAIYPQFKEARLASWAVVQDMSSNNVQIRQAADFACCWDPILPLFKTVAIGLVPGTQSVARAELYALLIALRAAMSLPASTCVVFVTDCQYVVNMIRKIVSQGPNFISGKTCHADILNDIASMWDTSRFQIRKVRSHQSFSSAQTLSQLWDRAGNHCADIAATSSLKNIPKPLRDISDENATWVRTERIWLRRVCHYFLALVRQRMELFKLPENTGRHDTDRNGDASQHVMPPNLFGEDAFRFLTDFHPADYSMLPSIREVAVPDAGILQLFLQGANIAQAMCRWCQTLKWPSNLDSSYLVETDWGILWAELFVNFLLVTGLFFPIKISGNGSTAVFVDYESDAGRLSPWSRRSLANQIICLQRSLVALSNLTDHVWFPQFNVQRVTSAKHINWKVQGTGIPCRPVMEMQRETMMVVKKLTSKPLTAPLDRPEFPPFLSLPALEELSVNVRYKKYLLHMNAKRVARRGG